MFIENDIGLIGDALGTIPVIISLSQIDSDLTYLCLGKSGKNAKSIYDLIPKKYNIEIIDNPEIYPDGIVPRKFDLSKAFDISVAKNLHMTQAHFEFFGLPIPEKPIRPELEFPVLDVKSYDYILAPFSRCLPEDQKWPQDNWNKLVDMMPESTFAVFGDDRHDKRDYVFLKPNVEHVYSTSFHNVINVMKNVKRGLLSVVTGISHLCYPLDVPNVLLVNQNMAWGKNPDAIYLSKPIYTYSPQEVASYLRSLPSRK